jgi:hypothetical protein
MPEWTWRQRLRDPRFTGLLVAGAGGCSLAAVTIGFDLAAAIFALAVLALLGLLALPQWRDEAHELRRDRFAFGAGVGHRWLGLRTMKCRV